MFTYHGVLIMAVGIVVVLRRIGCFAQIVRQLARVFIRDDINDLCSLTREIVKLDLLGVTASHSSRGFL